MTPVYQTKFTDEAKGKRGNCLAACLASLVGVSLVDVPAIEELPDKDTHPAILAFLGKHGYAFHGFKPGMPPHDGREYLTSFRTPCSEHFTHCVIVRNGMIVHDPRRPLVPLGEARWHVIILEGEVHGTASITS